MFIILGFPEMGSKQPLLLEQAVLCQISGCLHGLTTVSLKEQPLAAVSAERIMFLNRCTPVMKSMESYVVLRGQSFTQYILEAKTAKRARLSRSHCFMLAVNTF